MHPKSETELLAFAREFIRRQGDDVEAAREDFLNEARARYAAIDDGDDREAYFERAKEIFVEAAS